MGHKRITAVTISLAAMLIFACIPSPAASVPSCPPSPPQLDLPRCAFESVLAVALGIAPASDARAAAAPLLCDALARFAQDAWSGSSPVTSADSGGASSSARGSAGAKSSPTASSLVTTARGYSGVRYRWAGMSSRGMDCSGLIARVLKAHGIRAPHNSAQLFRLGRAVSLAELKPGDLLFFRTSRRGISHVGMYIGGGKFIHASSGAGRVITTSIRDPYYSKRFVGARRLDDK